MKLITPGYALVSARVTDIPYIMTLERPPDSRRFVVQGTAWQHMREIASPAYRLLVVRHAKDGARAGFCLCHIDRANRALEIRRVVMSQKGGGAATEALPALFGYAFDVCGLMRVWLDVYADNPRAMALYERLGMQRDGVLRQSHRDADGGFRDQYMFSLLRTDAAGRDYGISRSGRNGGADAPDVGRAL